MLNEKQEQLLRHMLGADERYAKKKWGFRNYYCASDNPNCKSRIELEKMETLGLVTSGELMGYKTFWATKEGAVAIGFKPYQLRNADLLASAA